MNRADWYRERRRVPMMDTPAPPRASSSSLATRVATTVPARSPRAPVAPVAEPRCDACWVVLEPGRYSLARHRCDFP